MFFNNVCLGGRLFPVLEKNFFRLDLGGKKGNSTDVSNI